MGKRIFYAGIGSRKTPQDILQAMYSFAADSAIKGFVLRSGGAVGADSAFEMGHRDQLIAYPNVVHQPVIYTARDYINPVAFDLAKEIHPAFGRIKSETARRLIARNMQQILGDDLATPVDFVVCWTPDGCESIESYGRSTGGTGSAIALASCCNIPVFNLRNKSRLYRAYMLSDTLSEERKK